MAQTNDFIPIYTQRLCIRRLNMTDIKEFFGYRSLPEIYQYQSWQPKKIDEAEEFIKNNETVQPSTMGAWLQVAICDMNGKLAGDIGIHFLDNDDEAEIGYTLAPAYQGMGYASEAVGAVITYLLNVLKKKKIVASVDPDNAKSVRLLEKLGFVKTAHYPKSYQINGLWYDDCIYEIKQREWKWLPGI